MEERLKMNIYSQWINDCLSELEKRPAEEAASLLSGCGRACAERRGAIEGNKQLRELAAGCRTRSDYVAFLNTHLPAQVRFTECEDGILFSVGNERCSCPMAEEVKNPILCSCTCGFNKAAWSEFFGRDVEVEVVESHLRGGKDCVFKIKIGKEL